jgi:hypothetical protein
VGLQAAAHHLDFGQFGHLASMTWWVARSGTKMGWWSPCDAVSLWSLQAVI